MRLAILALLLVGCSGPTAAPVTQVAVATPEHHAVAVPAAPALPTAAVADAEQAGLDAMEEQIQGQTMFCVASANDCPSGFRCDDGACVAR